MTKERERFIQGLRQLADFLEQNPGVPCRRRATLTMWRWKDEKDLSEVTRLLGTSEKIEHQDSIGIRRRFGPVTLQFEWFRGMTCKREVVGHKIVKTVDWSKSKLVKEPVIRWSCPDSFIKGR